jgi:hypothetical protein
LFQKAGHEEYGVYRAKKQSVQSSLEILPGFLPELLKKNEQSKTSCASRFVVTVVLAETLHSLYTVPFI